MKIGQQIVYIDGHGKQHAASVLAVPDTGPSGAKILNVDSDGTTFELVPHGNDRVGGKPYWLLVDEVDKAPDRRAPDNQQPEALAVEEATGELPSVDRRAGSGRKRKTKNT